MDDTERQTRRGHHDPDDFDPVHLVTDTEDVVVAPSGAAVPSPLLRYSQSAQQVFSCGRLARCRKDSHATRLACPSPLLSLIRQIEAKLQRRCYAPTYLMRAYGGGCRDCRCSWTFPASRGWRAAA